MTLMIADPEAEAPTSRVPDLPAVHATALVPSESRAVLLAPHPDDEVLGAAGLLMQLAAAGRELLLVSVTDGEASHPGSRLRTPQRLAHMRYREARKGMSQLGLADVPHARLRFPDRGLHLRVRELERTLSRLLREDDVVITTWRRDRHRDHRVLGEAGARLARGEDRRLVELPIWASVDALEQPGNRLRARRIVLTEAQRVAKRRAIAEHRTQLDPDPDVPGGAVLDPGVLDAQLEADEIVLT